MAVSDGKGAGSALIKAIGRRRRWSVAGRDRDSGYGRSRSCS